MKTIQNNNWVDAAVKLYQIDNKSVPEISEELDVPAKNIYYYFKKNVKLRKISRYTSKYNKNHDFFENPLSWEEKHAYFLGWLMSDGHHNIKAKSISIRLQARDKKILEILKDIIEYTF